MTLLRQSIISNIVFVNNVDEFDSLPKRTQIEFFCKECGKLTQKKVGASHQRILQRRLLCRKCSTIETCRNKYNVDNVSQVPEVQSKKINTNLKKYGETHYNKSLNASKHHRKLYLYDNIYFDSSWELIFYVWNIEHGVDIKRCSISFTYEFRGTTHTYFPDFEVEGQLYEIKGDHFFKEDGTMQNPYDHTQDALFEAKHQCGINNNVKFMSSSDIEPMLQFIVTKFGKDFLESHCRVRKSPKKKSYVHHPRKKRLYLNVWVNNPEDFDVLKRGDTFRYKCKNCKTECSFKKRDKTRWENQRRLLCINCQRKDTIMKNNLRQN